MRLLIVGSLKGHIGGASKIAMDGGAKVVHAEDVNSALATLRAGQGVELVFIDVTLDIARLIKSLESERIAVPVVACGIGTDADAAVDAIKAGAKEYIPLPPDSELIAAVLAAVAEESHDLIYSDPSMAEVLSLARQVATSNASVFISGESGTGKELMARYIHRMSKRKTRDFVSVNCAAIPENLLESELFGHEKGAFTGAVARRIGKFEEADSGTLLLDEISEMHPRLQAKLLRAIQEREIDRVGGTQPIKVDIRLIATSNRNLEDEVRKGNFRDDLYYRLNVVNLRLPSLRNRKLDVPILAEHFIEKYSIANGVPVRAMSEATRRQLMQHSWPGNVRELENTMHRSVLLAKGDEIGPEAIMLTSNILAAERDGDNVAPGDQTMDAAAAHEALIGRTVADVERDLILSTLEHCLGNRTHAANILGISIRTLRNKLKQYTEEGAKVPTVGKMDRVTV